jgi:hypothetical protein
MKFMTKNAWLIMGLAAAFTVVTPQSRGATIPEFSDLSLGNVNTAGLDGNLRLVFDLNAPATFPPALTAFVFPFFPGPLGQTVWVVNPTGTVVAVGTPSIPSTGGDTWVQGQADGNTSVLFAFPNGSIGLWTYSPSGAVIASVVYGPFTNTTVRAVKRQEATGQFLVEWFTTVTGGTAVSAWTLNEFGGIVTAAGPFGPFTNTAFQGINLLKNGTQSWVWASAVGGGYTTALWSVTTAGVVQTAQQFGPF